MGARSRSSRALALAAALAALPAQAGRPLTTEDASILDEKRCQLEAWVDRSREATQSWLVPACNFGAQIEWQLGFARAHAQGENAFSGGYFQAKTAWALGADSPWSMGLVAGVTRKVRETHRRWENPYVIVPLSFAGEKAPVLVHLNAGWGRDRAERRDVTLWGVALEKPLSPRFTLLGEAFGENASKPFVRGGGRMKVIEGQLDLDLTLVGRPGGTRADRFVSLGLYWQSARFLP